MSLNGWLQISLFFLVVLALATPIGTYLTAVFERRRTFLDPVLRPIERLLYKATGVNEDEEMKWTGYLASMLIFSGVTLLLTYAIERLQHHLPLNPQGLAAVPSNLAWSTAVSFTTNTNWQAYTPEATMSYLTQMLGLATHNFWSAAVGLALAIAFIRGIARREMKTLGNFWVDLTRGTFWVLVPISAVFALTLVSQGVIQNFRPYDTVKLMEAQKVTAPDASGKQVTTDVTTQTIAQGPIASQEAIKMLGTNGGGFTNANSSHPFENPTPLSNFLQMLSIFLIPAGLTVTLGQMTKSPKHGWAVFTAMSVLWLAGVFTAYWAEAQPNHLLHNVTQATTEQQAGGNMEGKEVRFGIANSALFATVTTDASCGAINAQHDSFSPLGGMIPMVNILLGESRLRRRRRRHVRHAHLRHSVGLHRRPDGWSNARVSRQERSKSYDIQMAMLYLLIFPLIILGFSAVAILSPTYGLVVFDEPWPAWPLRDPLRLHQRDGQQRQRLRRPHDQHQLLEPDPRRSHVLRALPDA